MPLADYIALDVNNARYPQVVIQSNRLVQQRIGISPLNWSIKARKELCRWMGVADVHFVGDEHDWPHAQNIQYQNHSQPAERYTKDAPGSSWQAVLGFIVHTASFKVLSLCCL